MRPAPPVTLVLLEPTLRSVVEHEGGLLVQQVDTPGKAALVAVAFAYVGLVLLVPTFNVFAQVRVQSPAVLSACRALALALSGAFRRSLTRRSCLVWQAFHKGFGPFLEHLTDPDFLHAVRRTLA